MGLLQGTKATFFTGLKSNNVDLSWMDKADDSKAKLQQRYDLANKSAKPDMTKYENMLSKMNALTGDSKYLTQAISGIKDTLNEGVSNYGYEWATYAKSNDFKSLTVLANNLIANTVTAETNKKVWDAQFKDAFDHGYLEEPALVIDPRTGQAQYAGMTARGYLETKEKVPNVNEAGQLQFNNMTLAPGNYNKSLTEIQKLFATATGDKEISYTEFVNAPQGSILSEYADLVLKKKITSNNNHEAINAMSKLLINNLGPEVEYGLQKEFIKMANQKNGSVPVLAINDDGSMLVDRMPITKDNRGEAYARYMQYVIATSAQSKVKDKFITDLSPISASTLGDKKGSGGGDLGYWGATTYGTNMYNGDMFKRDTMEIPLTENGKKVYKPVEVDKLTVVNTAEINKAYGGRTPLSGTFFFMGKENYVQDIASKNGRSPFVILEATGNSYAMPLIDLGNDRFTYPANSEHYNSIRNSPNANNMQRTVDEVKVLVSGKMLSEINRYTNYDQKSNELKEDKAAEYNPWSPFKDVNSGIPYEKIDNPNALKESAIKRYGEVVGKAIISYIEQMGTNRDDVYIVPVSLVRNLGEIYNDSNTVTKKYADKITSGNNALQNQQSQQTQFDLQKIEAFKIK